KVAKDTKPFIVDVNGVAIHVHGTEFNVRAYQNQLEVQAALVQGSISVVTKANGVNHPLIPGQILNYNSENNSTQILDDGAKEVSSWKDGVLYFRSTSLATVLERLSGWYGFEFVFDKIETSQRLLTGVAYTEHELEHTLKLLSASTGVSYYWKNNKLYIYL